MGVPKFYRWISERYPCLSEVVREFQIPDFDNLYLDMNGIIHVCSHPNDDDPHFRITEEEIFQAICYYIDFLFKMIKPNKVFFMAIDGVAPRAKMNQQRGRRFRTAKSANDMEDQAKALGEVLPTEARFDSNCITPGTPFMARLHSCLQRFVSYKITTDKLWQNVRVYLSGHETPGEGEHKIMDFIRYEKSQPGYNPNTRHCLYGLDADLIMLGLCSHEPHFSLLREEVKFGGGSKKKQKRIATPEETTFHLLHISLLRDYLNHEFSPVKSKISFPFDLEQIIDDFVLMSFLVGNDFIPHLPQLHIHHDALPMLFQTYMDVLPSLGGYINEKGYLNLERFQKFLTKLAEYDFKKFGETSEDFEYLERKSKARKDVEEKSTANFLANLGFSDAAINEIAEFESSSDEDNIEEETTLELEFSMHKSDYYRTKLELESTPEVLKDQAEGYVRAIQWNLHYYYNGCMSWSWYYPHHYSPYISDVKDFKDMELKFDLGKPFLPFQQLLAVLPKLSKDLLPESYQKLMCDENSPLIDFYPDAFMTDLNGKQQEWEAVVLIPFINEKLLVKFAEMADKDLNEDERKRNVHGPHLLYTYSEKPSGPVLSFLPKHYPSLSFNHSKLTKIDADFFRLPADSIYKGLCQGVVMDKFLIGFPTLKTLKHSANLRNAKVKVFQMTSLKENMMLHIEEPTEEDMNKLCEKMLGKIVYIGWPHLREAVVVSISDGKTNYASERDRQAKSIKVVEENMDGDGKKIWDLQVKGVEEQNYQRWGIVTGDIKVLVHVRCFSGSKFIISKEGKVTEDKQFEGIVSNFPLQTIVPEVKLFSPVVKEDAIAEEVFKSGTVIFALAPQHYGSMGKVVDGDVSKNNGMVLVNLEVSTEPDLWPVIENKEEHMLERFIPGYVIAQRVGVESHFVSRMTGTFLVQTSPKGSSSPNRANIGLNLKFNRKNEEVQGFSKKIDNQWLYSEEVAQILNEYLSKFADFFERLHKYLNSDVVYCEDLYPNGEGPNTVKEIAAWLKEQSCSLADRQTCGMKKLDHGIVAAIERAVENTINEEIYHVKKSIPPNHLHCPYFCRGVFMPDLKAKFNLFDRVVNVSPSSSVPLGLKGTVIGIQSAEKDSDYIYEIFFDKEFYGGFAIGFTSKKGYRMPPNSLINLSFGNKSKKSQSPSKSARNSAPKLLKNNLFDSALKNLPQVSSNLGHPKNSTPITIQKKPFYKADSIDLFSNLSQDPQYVSPVFSPNWSGNKQFVTPTVSGGFNGSPNNMQQKNASIQSEFQNLWVNMKKNPESPVNCAKPKASPVKSRSPKPEPVKPQAEQTYGQKLSVEELFQVAQNQNQIEATHQQNVQRLQNITLGPQATIEAKAPDLLREFCLDYYKAPPLFTYNNFGSTALYVATITLPSGIKVSSIPCPSKFDAAGNASGKALAYCQSLPKRPTSSPNPRHKTDVRPQDSFMNPALLQHLPPSFQPEFTLKSLQPEYQPFQFPYGPPPFIRPPGIGQQPPMGYPPPFPPACFEPPIMRHPPPMHSSNIPDSFVRANQVMYGEPEPQTMRVKTQNPDPKDKIADKDVIHLPGGVTAMIRNSKVSDTNMFVPAQVMKNAIKTPHDAPLSNNEWPNLPNKAPDNNVPPQTVSPKVERTKPNSSPKPKTESNSVKETHPKGMTVLKPKSKRRIAANFQNPTTE